MPDLRLTPLAREDIMDIGRYTQATWGPARRDAYLKSIGQTLETIRDGTGFVQARDDIRPDVLSCLCSKHIIFFRHDASGNVEVLRVLHQRMDFDRHL